MELNWTGWLFDISTDALAKYKFFHKVFERQDMYRFLIQKKAQHKNKVTRNLSSFAVEKFNGYKIKRRQLARQERIELTPINIVYERFYDKRIPMPCLLTDQIYLACRSFVGRFEKGVE